MKKIIVSILLLAVFGCTDLGEGTTYIYTVKNESGKTIKVESYISYKQKVSPITTIIANGDKITKKYEDGSPPSGYSFKSFFGESSHRDSIIVIYGNEKFTIFIQRTEGCGSDRSPLNMCLYGDAIETFIFTEEDYENSEPCDGECN